jgi:hypothetical protein
MKKALPEKMFGETDQPRLTTLRNWVLENEVTETYTIVGFAGARWISRMSPWCTVAT